MIKVKAHKYTPHSALDADFVSGFQALLDKREAWKQKISQSHKRRIERMDLQCVHKPTVITLESGTAYHTWVSPEKVSTLLGLEECRPIE